MKRKFFSLFFILIIMAGCNNKVEYIAHRGASYLAPENTLASAKLAWELGADAVEVDIYLAKDNKVMVIHDRNTLRVTGQDYKVTETSSDTLRKLDAGSWKGEAFRGEKIPFLEEEIKLLPSGKTQVVELKSNKEVIPWMKKVIEESGKSKQMVFISFDWETIVETKKEFPENACYWLCGNKEATLQKMPEIPVSGLDGVDLNFSAIDEETVKEAKKYGLDVIAYTVNDPEEAKRLISLGVKKITTDRPAWLKEQLE